MRDGREESGGGREWSAHGNVIQIIHCVRVLLLLLQRVESVGGRGVGGEKKKGGGGRDDDSFPIP